MSIVLLIVGLIVLLTDQAEFFALLLPFLF
jgi:hypothetical protein